MAASEEFVKGERSGGIGTITFGSPKANSLSTVLIDQLIVKLKQFDGDPAVRVIVLQSNPGSTFCAGASFGELERTRTREEADRFFGGFARILIALRDLRKFVVAKVHGKIVGGGVGLVAGCDYAIATADASVRLSEFALGIGPFVIGPAVERRVGSTAFAALAIDTEWRDAAWAYAHGLYDKIVTTPAELEAEVAALAGRLEGASGEATAELRKVTWHRAGDWEKVLFERAQISGKLWVEKGNKVLSG